jgi:hypothetical protein
MCKAFTVMNTLIFRDNHASLDITKELLFVELPWKENNFRKTLWVYNDILFIGLILFYCRPVKLTSAESYFGKV